MQVGAPIPPRWPQCGETARREALSALASGESLDFARGVPFDGQMLVQVLDAAPRGPDGRFQLTGVRFDLCVFEGRVPFQGVEFLRGARFDSATFEETAYFIGATFDGGARFDGATFNRWAQFDQVSFKHGPVGARLIQEDATGNTKEEVTSFNGAQFNHWASFIKGRFERLTSFVGATFDGPTHFNGARFDECSFNGTDFRGEAYLGSVFAARLSLEEAVFLRPRLLTLSATTISADRLGLPEGAALEVSSAEVDLAHISFTAPTTLSRWIHRHEDDEAVHGDELNQSVLSDRPRVVSLRGANVEKLVLTDVDMSACRFAGSHNLDQLRMEGVTSFARAPSRWNKRRGRQALAEEHQWRREKQGRKRWYPPSCQSSMSQGAPLLPVHIASLYRALRRARERIGDKPGAADFYFGEMEMRRNDTLSTPPAERFILFLYWLLSGYGLRASRALVALACTIVLFAGLFESYGFHSSNDFHPSGILRAEALTYSAATAVFALGGIDRELTVLGDVFRIALRMIGPLLLGLAVVSLRGRVRR